MADKPTASPELLKEAREYFESHAAPRNQIMAEFAALKIREAAEIAGESDNWARNRILRRFGLDQEAKP